MATFFFSLRGHPMQTVLLEIINGPQINQRIWIRLGQIIRLGSAEHADVVIESDRTLAPVHLSFGHSRAGCFVECLERTASISVNGRKMPRSRVHHGDIVLAGETEFRAIVSNDMGPGAERSARSSNALPADQASRKTVDAAEPEKAIPGTIPAGSVESADQPNCPEDKAIPPLVDYQAARLTEGAWQLSTDSPAEFPLSEMIRMLAGKFNCFACGDVALLGGADSLTGEEYRLHQLDATVAIRQFSEEGVLEMFGSRNACQLATIIFSSQAFERVIRSVSTQLFSFRRPGIFATQICVATPGIARSLFQDMTAILMVDESNNWQVFTSQPVDQAWQELGLPNQPRQHGR